MFDPETAAKTIIPKDLLGQASSLHLAMHFEDSGVEALLAEAAGGDAHWAAVVPLESENDTRLIEIIQSKNWHEKVFRKCTLSYHSSKFTLVPKAFFLPERAHELLTFSCGEIRSTIEYLEVPELDAVLVFELPTWHKQMLRIFPNARIFPSAFLLLRYAHAKNSRKGDGIFVARTDGFMLVAVMRDQHLLLLNHFAVQNEEDILYHISNAAMRLGVDLEHVGIELITNNADSALTHLLSHYNRDVQIPFTFDADSNSGCFTQLHVLCA